jgi:hypothetical protein
VPSNAADQRGTSFPELNAAGRLAVPHHPNEEVQASRRITDVPCGRRGTIHDYVPFYFGPLSVMLLNLKTGRVAGYNEGQSPIVYLVSSVQSIVDSGSAFAFSDGHGLARFTGWYDHLEDLKAIDWDVVGARYWRDTLSDNDRKRRKQAEFLVHGSVSWNLISEIGVYNEAVATEVRTLLSEFPDRFHPPVIVRSPDWYYY